MREFEHVEDDEDPLNNNCSNGSIKGLSANKGGCNSARSLGGVIVHWPYGDIWSSIGLDSQILSLGNAKMVTISKNMTN